MIAALCLGYEVTTPARYGIRAPERELAWLPAGRYCVLLHATSRADKLWPEEHWLALGGRLLAAGFGLALPWGSEAERERAQRLAARLPGAVVPPRLELEDAAALLGGAAAVAGVDTGLSHLAAALGVPVVGIYCATDPGSTGVHGSTAVNLGGVNGPPSVAEVSEALASLAGLPGGG
jgi:heptosyltransferase-1